MKLKYFLSPDVYIRHWLVAKKLGKNKNELKTVLDVGGCLGELKKFSSKYQITTVDVAPGADYIYDGRHLPFSSNSFDIVVSIDTLEHILPLQRMDFISELNRVAKKCFIVIAPFASPRHVIYESQLRDKLIDQKQEIPKFLEEHIKYGLISKKFLSQIRNKFPRSKYSLVGNVFLDRINFHLHLFSSPFSKLDRIIYLVKLPLYFIENLLTPWLYRWTDNDIASRVLIFIRVL